MEAYRLPKNSEEEKKTRTKSVSDATKNAILVPFTVMETALSAFPLIREMIEKGNPSSVTDAAVGALALRSCIKGAFLNVKVNAAGLDDRAFAKDIIQKGSEIESEAARREDEILKITEAAILKQSKP